MKSKNKKSYAVFKAGNFNEQGLKAFCSQLAKLDCAVADVSASNKPRKKDGRITKSAKLYFDNQQVIEIVIGEDGDIITLKVNNKAQPAGEPKRLSDFAKHISGLLKKGQNAFDASLAKRLTRIKTKTADKKPAAKSMKIRLEESQEEQDKAQAAFNEIMQIRDSEQSSLDQSKSEHNELLGALKTAQSENKALRAKFK